MGSFIYKSLFFNLPVSMCPLIRILRIILYLSSSRFFCFSIYHLNLSVDSLSNLIKQSILDQSIDLSLEIYGIYLPIYYPARCSKTPRKFRTETETDKSSGYAMAKLPGDMHWCAPLPNWSWDSQPWWFPAVGHNVQPFDQAFRCCCSAESCNIGRHVEFNIKSKTVSRNWVDNYESLFNLLHG